VTRSQLIIQRNETMLVTPGYGRDRIAAIVRRCAELKSIVAGNFVYRLSPIALWGSAARGIGTGDILSDLERHSITGVPVALAAQISELVSRYGVIELHPAGDRLRLTSSDPEVLSVIDLGGNPATDGVLLTTDQAGRVKLAAARAGWPVVERGRQLRKALDIRLLDSVKLRRYQQDAVHAFHRAGSGVILLPCGSGKTMVGIAAICRMKASTLILSPSRSVAEQWRETLISTTSITPSDVSIADTRLPLTPVTIATYHAASMGGVAGRLLDHHWDMVIYDEVQSLPADVFRLSAALQADRRLGLSATLVREDGRQNEVFALVGPPVFDVPWVELEAEGWIAPAHCVEVRIPQAEDGYRAGIFKMAVIERLLARHRGQPTLIVGSQLDGLHQMGARFGIPVLSGKSSRTQRAASLDSFREGRISRLALSRIGSVGIDLPSAEVLIQISGTFGSRQEEAQRLGRILRPSPGKVAWFYSLVSEGTNEPRYAARRQRFLVEQGYEYDVLDAADLPRPQRVDQ
jgi:DNA excision repair protein ERCC-3